MTTVDTIAEAIKEKKSLAFAYHGFDRVVSPYACGLTPTNEIKMIGFQIGGGSNSGVTEKLRFYSTAYSAGVTIVDDPFRPATEEDKAVFAQLAKIYEEVQ